MPDGRQIVLIGDPSIEEKLDKRRQEERHRAEQIRERARFMFFEQGMSYRAIAQRLGTAHSNVRRWIDPRAAEADRTRKTQQQRQKRAEMRLATAERSASPFDLLTNGGRVEGSTYAEDRYEGAVGSRRRKMPVERRSITHHVRVDGFGFYVTAGMYEDGTVGEVFIKGAGKEGSTVQGLLDGFATMWSIGVQYGAEFDMLVRKFAHTRFPPFGETDNPDIPYAWSLLDYCVRWLALHFGSPELNADLHRISEEMGATS